ncbi:MAG: Serine O-acetyltransferase [Candidatus Tokpelaia hoelldobleri]|uniref:Serine acetyltransferase n=1 Tax=Candidatus Tokpelaia hoelldobleri TaxID=1902579 RepID=A0A1U9JV42_9HYPH|nr:MAG: Serine O-acetyltransferase [Candidatus Tokpelaia hoelldoblerii]
MSALAKLNKKQKKTHDVLWQQIYAEAEQAFATDNIMGGFLRSCVLNHDNLEQAVIARLTDRLYYGDIDRDVLHNTLLETTTEIVNWPECLYADIVAVVERDPASHRLLDPLLYLKGFHAIQTHRIAHACWRQGRTDFAYYLQSRSSTVFQTDIHPAARVGSGIFLDHATGLVVGETAVMEDNVSILHGVTLGGTGKAERDRHPKIRHGVLIGAGAKILGNIEVGACSKIAAGSVVLKPVPEGVTVAGVPAQIIGKAGSREPARNMDQTFAQGEGI